MGPVRSFFIPDVPKFGGEPDHVYLTVDYDKIELRVMCWESNDPVMYRELTSGIDLHTHMAVVMRLKRMPTPEEFASISLLIDKGTERALAKAVNFGIPYGRSAAGIVDAKENAEIFPLGMDRRTRIKKVQKVIDLWWKKYRKIKEWSDQTIWEMKKRDGLVVDSLGRKRRLDGYKWLTTKYGRGIDRFRLEMEEMERQAVNFKVQSRASAELHRATRRVHDGMKKIRIPTLRVVMSVHDELVFCVHRNWVDDAEHHIPVWMNTVLRKAPGHKYELPLRVNVDRERAYGQKYEAHA
jgi:DNA polymerase-1